MKFKEGPGRPVPAGGLDLLPCLVRLGYSGKKLLLVGVELVFGVTLVFLYAGIGRKGRRVDLRRPTGGPHSFQRQAAVGRQVVEETVSGRVRCIIA